MRKIKIIMSLLLSYTMMSQSCMSLLAENGNFSSDTYNMDENINDESFVEEESVSLENELVDSESLFEGYVYQKMYSDFGIGLYSSGNYGVDSLDVNTKTVYKYLDNFVQDVASGNITSTVIEWESNLEFDALDSTDFKNQVRTTIFKAVDLLLVNSPYDLYWFDKTSGYSFGYNYYPSTSETSYILGTLTMKFSVAEEFSNENGSPYSTSASKTKVTTTAVQNAKTIVNNASSYDEYSKMLYFKEQICDLVSYNDDAVENDYPYGNPWQLIYVFDNDSTTNVVCEGYSKAFQYLCDLSGLTCYTVTGILDGGTGAGRHMWNIVKLEGVNYLIDVTNCDTGTIGAPDQLFLKGMNGNTSSVYTKEFGLTTLTYTYDDDQFDLYGDILTISSTDYIYSSNENVSIALDKETITLNVDEQYTLTATIVPSNCTSPLTWKSSDTSVATVNNGTITPVSVGTATITAMVEGKTATCKVTVTSKLTSISLNKATTTVEKGQTETLTVSYNPTDTTDDKTVTWTSSNTNVATVEDGVVTALKVGTATITATVGTHSATCNVTVTSKLTSISLNKATTTVEKGQTETLKVSYDPTDTTDDKTVTWTSSDENVITVEDGTITALKVGTATITATVGTHSATCSVIVVNPITSVTLDKESANVFVGSTTTLIATINPEDTHESKTITWSSDNEEVATVSSKGVVTAKKAGTAIITASTESGKADTCTVNGWNKTSNVSSVKNGETGIDVTWKEVPGATKYSIYRKVDGGSWKALKTGITTTSYTDTTAESGKKYYYSMLATDGTIKSTYSTTGKYVTYLSKPVISSGKNTQKELKITWKAVTGAASYIIYDEAGNKVGTSTTTSFTDTKATVSGTTYNYQVKAKVGSGTYSALSDTKSCMKLAQPTLSSAKNGETGVKFTWKAVNGALKYTVYRKVDGGSWKSLKTGVTETTYTDTSATSGKKYYYSVKAVNGSATSTYNTTGNGVTYLSRPLITKVTKAKTYNSVKFNAVTGAESYIVYSVNDDGKQTKLGTVTAGSATSYTYKDTSATKAGTYRYVVKAKVGSATYSAYSEVFEYNRK